MSSIRRYGPALVAPEVAPRPELGQGREQAFAAFQGVLGAANEFIRPAVEQVQTARGEKEALDALNDNTFEPRLPFTVRSAAFAKAADRVVGARAMTALEEGIQGAMQRANGDVGKLRSEMEAVRSSIMGSIPGALPGLATELQLQFDRSMIVAERQAIELGRRRVVARQQEAAGQLLTTTQAEAERLALTGATSDELADYLATATDSLLQFGPPEGFEIAGRVYAPDPSRAGVLSVGAVAEAMDKIGAKSARLLIEADFMKSEAPSQYAAEFRRQVFEGNSPLPADESLDLLRSMEGQARAAESARRSAAEARRVDLQAGMTDTINAYVSMGDAGVPVAIPAEERARILSDLAPYPEMQRQAEIAFQVADAQVQTHGMTGDQLMGYVASVRADMAAAAGRGELDLGGAAVIASLSDQVKKLQDGVTAETIGLPLVEQLAMSGGRVEDVDYVALREAAAGKPELLAEVAEVEALHNSIVGMEGMSATERALVVEKTREAQARLAASGRGFGASALATEQVLDGLEKWSEHRRVTAAEDPVRFAAMVGVPLRSFDGVETMGQAGSVIVERVKALAPKAQLEGVENPVPLTAAEAATISEVFDGSSRGERMSFVSSVAALGPDQAMAVFSRIGQSDPIIYSAGAVYLMGNQAAANVILRGAGAPKVAGAEPQVVSGAREVVLGPLLLADMITDAGIQSADATAIAYANGLAVADGGRPVTSEDVEEGYQIALGRQADGTGGMAETAFGDTILPPGWTAKRLNRALSQMTQDQLTAMAGASVQDGFGRPLSADDLLRTIEGLRPAPEDPFILVPVDADGAFFLTKSVDRADWERGLGEGILTFDLRDFEK